MLQPLAKTQPEVSPKWLDFWQLSCMEAVNDFLKLSTAYVALSPFYGV